MRVVFSHFTNELGHGCPYRGLLAGFRRNTSAFCLVILFTLAGILPAATTVVTNTSDNGAGTLRDALASAADGDTVTFSVPTPAAIVLTSGALVVSRSVTILGPGPSLLKVDGGGSDRVWAVIPETSNVTVTIANMTIANGIGGAGGGILNICGTLTVSNCILSGNAAGGGGGIYNDGQGCAAVVHLVDSIVTNNLATSAGGGIFNDGSDGGVALLMIDASSISQNAASNENGGIGGGILNLGVSGSATVTINSSTLSSNACTWNGAGIFNEGPGGGNAIVAIHSSTLSDNWAAQGGGGIFNNGESLGNAVVTVSSSTFSGNSANGVTGFGAGGAIYSDGVNGSASVTIEASTFSANTTAGFRGGGIILNDCGNCISVTLEIGNTILKAGAKGGTIANTRHGTVISRGYNLCSDSASGFLTAPGDQVNTDPLLDPAGLRDNGGPTFTIALQSGSPAVDKGKGDAVASLMQNTDQRGLPRPFDDPYLSNAPEGDGSDIGAYEVQTLWPGPCGDLSGVWSNVVQTCRTKAGVVRCKIKGSLSVVNIGTADAETSFARCYLSSDTIFDANDTLLKEYSIRTVELGRTKRLSLKAKLPEGISASGQYILAVFVTDGSIAACTDNIGVFGPLP